MDPENLTSSSAIFSCGVLGESTPQLALFEQSYELAEGLSGALTLSGVTTLAAGTPLSVECFDYDTNQTLTISGADWYVALVKTS